MADPEEKETNDLEALIKSIDTNDPKEMRIIWEGFSLDKNPNKKDEEG